MFSNAFVVCLGMGTVFVGLIVIILLCSLMSFFVRLIEKKQPVVNSVSHSVVSGQAAQAIPDKPALVAAVSAVVAEELGTEISNIRIHSIKRI